MMNTTIYIALIVSVCCKYINGTNMIARRFTCDITDYSGDTILITKEEENATKYICNDPCQRLTIMDKIVNDTITFTIHTPNTLPLVLRVYSDIIHELKCNATIIFPTIVDHNVLQFSYTFPSDNGTTYMFGISTNESNNYTILLSMVYIYPNSSNDMCLTYSRLMCYTEHPSSNTISAQIIVVMVIVPMALMIFVILVVKCAPRCNRTKHRRRLLLREQPS